MRENQPHFDAQNHTHGSYARIALQGAIDRLLADRHILKFNARMKYLINGRPAGPGVFPQLCGVTRTVKHWFNV